MAMAESEAGGHGRWLAEDGGGTTAMAMAESEAGGRWLDEDWGGNEASATARIFHKS